MTLAWYGETAQQSQLMTGSKGWKKQEPSVGERWVLGLRPRDSAGIAHLASVKRLTPRSRLTGIDSSGQTPLLLGIEACMGAAGLQIFSRGKCMHFVRQARQKFVITIIQSGSDCLALLGDHPFMER